MWAIVQPSTAKQVGKLHTILGGMQPPWGRIQSPCSSTRFYFNSTTSWLIFLLLTYKNLHQWK